MGICFEELEEIVESVVGERVDASSVGAPFVGMFVVTFMAVLMYIEDAASRYLFPVSASVVGYALDCVWGHRAHSEACWSSGGAA